MYEGGLKFCLRQVLRPGIMLLGLRLSLAAVGQIGLVGLPVIVGCIAVGARRWSPGSTRALGLPRRLGSLIAVGTSICGVSAIVATGPVIDAEEDEVSYAVACVTLFGLLALFSYPFLAHGLFRGDARLAGLFLGTAIHDTAQVAGAGLMYRQQYGAPEALNDGDGRQARPQPVHGGGHPLGGLAVPRSKRGACDWRRWCRCSCSGSCWRRLRTAGDSASSRSASSTRRRGSGSWRGRTGWPRGA